MENAWNNTWIFQATGWVPQFVCHCLMKWISTWSSNETAMPPGRSTKIWAGASAWRIRTAPRVYHPGCSACAREVGSNPWPTGRQGLSVEAMRVKAWQFCFFFIQGFTRELHFGDRPVDPIWGPRVKIVVDCGLPKRHFFLEWFSHNKAMASLQWFRCLGHSLRV